MFRADQRRVREFFLDGGEDLHPLDGINAKIGIKPHIEVKHLHRIAGLLADNRQQCRGSVCTFTGLGSLERLSGYNRANGYTRS